MIVPYMGIKDGAFAKKMNYSILPDGLKVSQVPSE